MDELTELKKQILRLEFQHKKDNEEIRENLKQTSKNLNHISKHLKHLSTLAGIAFERLDDLDDRLDNAAKSLARKKK